MLPTAHIASALLVNRLSGLDKGMGAAILGSLMPDAIDKTLAWILRIAPAARHIAHTPLAVIALSAVASAAVGRRQAMAFGAAYVVHLVADLWNGGHVPWLMPFKEYDVRGEPWKVELSSSALLLEAIGAATIVLLARQAAADRALAEDGTEATARG